MRKLILATLVVFVWLPPSYGQQQPLEQRIAAQIGNLFIQNTSQAVQIEQLQVALGFAQARVKVLEDKYEPKTAPSTPVEPKE